MTSGGEESNGWVSAELALQHRLACPYPRCFVQADLQAALASRPAVRGYSDLEPGPDTHRPDSDAPPSHFAFLSAVGPRHLRHRADEERELELALCPTLLRVTCRCSQAPQDCAPALLRALCRVFNQFHLALDQLERCLAR